MGWLITAGILLLLAILPLGVSVQYNDQGALVRLLVGPLKLTVFPTSKKSKKKDSSKASEKAVVLNIS